MNLLFYAGRKFLPSLTSCYALKWEGSEAHVWTAKASHTGRICIMQLEGFEGLFSFCHEFAAARCLHERWSESYLHADWDKRFGAQWVAECSPGGGGG